MTLTASIIDSLPMKIQTSSNTSSSFAVGTLHIVFTDGKSARFVEKKDGSQFLEFGLGKQTQTLRTLRIVVRRVVEEIKKHDATAVSFPNPKECSLGISIDEKALGELFAYNLLVANYVFTRYKSKKDAGNITVVFRETKSKAFEDGLKKGALLGESINMIRSIANTPGSDMTPRQLATDTRKTLAGTKTTVKILEKKEIAKLNMGALLGVAKGSKEDPRFIVIEYMGGKKNEKPIVFVGKGITFDTGGLSIKPADGMLDMHLDMTGGAVVIGALRTIAKLGIKRNVIGLIPSAENMVSGESYRPGDVLTTMSGKTVDVLNTDAEGRLVLADALTYAERYNPTLVVDVATLTGGALAALGQHASVIMTKDDSIAEKLSEYGEETGDYVWRLPLWDEYIKYTKGVHGDLANIQSSGNSRYGGAINGGAFLSHFATKFPWVHIDMAPRMTPATGDHLAKGATGEPMSLLVKIAEKY